MKNTTRTEFLKLMNDNFGYPTDSWKRLKDGDVLPLNAQVMTIGKDDDGYFYHLCYDAFNGVNVFLKNMGVTHWHIVINR
ncbi:MULTISPECIES: hypothetical protein [unclassified Acinetobacter]|uniref:hypothetical protein n=1 Tax=unclassified Acinetobacter TaxID=196816 RepID=UPI0015D113E1|nr:MULTISPECIES: hypothetical protein [unclassified Acinetobacter]